MLIFKWFAAGAAADTSTEWYVQPSEPYVKSAEYHYWAWPTFSIDPNALNSGPQLEGQFHFHPPVDQPYITQWPADFGGAFGQTEADAAILDVSTEWWVQPSEPIVHFYMAQSYPAMYQNAYWAEDPTRDHHPFEVKRRRMMGAGFDL